ncbi:hypothetical protein G4G28_21375 [Massilia sp. Dwa41.01b]|uniref:hypothetical protein n=1 Tax=unclassified Massilia TaxID=2609279 RepID=UPI0016022F28|nr:MULTISPECIES: hypothetical protein [unclassified Massilia]QNA90408.1 hypothetical protein G4G28_21375 [Massilia sp. Dwa41.01b]QNA97635.1 hypothetical protein G4G31_00455 [Massilia sp. Se16.2.3]
MAAATCSLLPAGAESLCAPHEPVVFACHVGTKIVSLCRPAEGEGVLSYRFGRPAALEMRYPEPGRPVRSAFTVSTLPLVGGGETTVAFERGGYTYTVYSRVARGADGATPEFEDGLLVKRRGKVVSKLRCEDGGEGFREPVAEWKMK